MVLFSALPTNLGNRSNRFPHSHRHDDDEDELNILKTRPAKRYAFRGQGHLSYIGAEKGEAGLKISAVLHTHDPKRLGDELANLSTLTEALKSQIHYLGDDLMGWRESRDILDCFFQIIDEVSALDPGSDTFRYTVTKMLSSNRANLHGLSLSKLEDVAGRFEATCRWLRQILEQHIDGGVNRDLSDSEMFDGSR